MGCLFLNQVEMLYGSLEQPGPRWPAHRGHEEGGLTEVPGSEQRLTEPQYLPGCGRSRSLGREGHVPSCCCAHLAEGPPRGCCFREPPAPHQSPRGETEGQKGTACREGGRGFGARHSQPPHLRSSGRAPGPSHESRLAACPPPPSASSSLAARAPTCLRGGERGQRVSPLLPCPGSPPSSSPPPVPRAGSPRFSGLSSTVTSSQRPFLPRPPKVTPDPVSYLHAPPLFFFFPIS